MTFTFKTNVGSLAASSTATSVTHNGVEFLLDGSYTAGHFRDGPAWVVDDGSGVGITADPLPAQATYDGGTINGSMLNPKADGTQGHDSRGTTTYSNVYNTWPASLVNGDVLVKSVGRQVLSIDERNGLTTGFGVLFILDGVPPANAFAPSSCSWNQRPTRREYRCVDVEAAVAEFPNYSSTGQTPPDYTVLLDAMPSFIPVWAQGLNSVGMYEQMFPYHSGGQHYGAAWLLTLNQVCLALCSDAYTTAQKEELFTRLLSAGFQWYDAIENTPDIFFEIGWGGHLQFHLVPFVLAAKYGKTGLNLPDMVDPFSGNSMNYRVYFPIDAAQAAAINTSHTDLTKPYPSHIRPITAVDAGDAKRVQIDTSTATYGDEGRIALWGLVCEAVVGGASSPVNSQESIDEGVPIWINLADDIGLSVSDEVFFRPITPVSAGDVVYGGDGYKDLRQVSLAFRPQYKRLTYFGSQFLTLKMLDAAVTGGGLWDLSWDPMLTYAQEADRASYLSTWNAYPGITTVSATSDIGIAGWWYQLGNGSGTTWEKEFIVDHLSTIVAL